MMDRFREGLSGPLAWTFLIVIVISFVFSGVSNFFVSGDGDKLAEVDGVKIGRNEFERAYQNARARYGEMFSQLFNTEEKELQFRRKVLEDLIAQQALTTSLEDLNLRISKDRLRDQIQAVPQFQRDGKYDRSTAEMTLAQVGLTPERYRADVEKNLVAMQMLRGLSDTAFALPNEAERFYQLENETLTGRFARLPLSAFTPSEPPADADIETYYNSHTADFSVPEKFNLQYVELNGAELQTQLTISDADVEAYYQAHLDQFTATERRKLAHILFTVPEGADSAAEAAVRAEATAVLAKIQAGEDFATLAQAHSADELSKQQGGELGVLEKGAMEPAFDDVAFALTVAKPVSEVVRSSFGFHVIKLLGIEGGEQQSLDSVREQVRSDALQQKLSELYADKEQLLTEKGYEIADQLDDAAAAAGLTVKETGLFERTAPTGIAALPGVLDAALGDEVLQERRNSALISVGDQHAVMIRVQAYQPATTKPLADVRGQIVTALNEQRGREAVQAFGNELLAKVRAGQDIGDALAEKNANWQQFEAIARSAATPDPIVRDQLFKLARPAETPTIAGLSLAGGDYLLAQLDKSTLPDVVALDGARRKQYEERISRSAGEAEYMAYVEWLKDHAEIVYFDSRYQVTEAASN